MVQVGQHILFVAYCWGGAGSTWLAWALNSHKQLLCLHAPKFPKFNRHHKQDVLTIVNAFYSLSALGSSYRGVGFTHGVRREWHSEFIRRYGEDFRGFILTRNPIKRINSLAAIKLKTSQKKTFSLRDQLARNRSYAKLVVASRRGDFPRDSASMGFYHSCMSVNRIVPEVKTGLPIYRFEDLVGTVAEFQKLLGYISNDSLTMDSDTILDLQGTVKGQHAPKRLSVLETYEAWSDTQKAAFQYLVTPQALLAYENLGYEIPEVVGKTS